MMTPSLFVISGFFNRLEWTCSIDPFSILVDNSFSVVAVGSQWSLQMKKMAYIAASPILFLAFIALPVRAGEALPILGKVMEGVSIESDLLGREVDFAIYLPPDYERSSRRYPVVYLLHGFTDDESAWIQFGEVHYSADSGILRGDLPAMIIVMPDGGVTWYINDYQNREPYERMFVEEFIPHIDKTFRTRSKKEFRGVAGLSMGGYGSLMLAMRNPDLFAACAAFSSGVITDEELVQMEDDDYQRLFSGLFGADLSAEERLNRHWREYNPLDLAENLSEESLRKVRWYIDCGDDDFLSAGNSALHLTLKQREIPHQYRVRDGAHNWTYWRTWIKEGLKFIGEGFHR
jgi:S-formylglutathione hydrolase FrmB